jgi:cell wall-associated NlpC family hydrolase
MQAAAAWAIAEKNSPNPFWSDHFGHQWSGYCEQFAWEADGLKSMPFVDHNAMDHYRWQLSQGRIHTDTNAPVGAVVFWGTGAPEDLGHVAVSIGNGQAVGTLGDGRTALPVSQYSLVGYFTTVKYLGWGRPVGS